MSAVKSRHNNITTKSVIYTFVKKMQYLARKMTHVGRCLDNYVFTDVFTIIAVSPPKLAEKTLAKFFIHLENNQIKKSRG